MLLPQSIRNYRLGLASQSPRRRELLGLLAVPFTVVDSIEVDETYPADLAPHDVPLYLSRLKADAYRRVMTDKDLFITADTVVIIDGRVLGKPRDTAEAKAARTRLSPACRSSRSVTSRVSGPSPAWSSAVSKTMR